MLTGGDAIDQLYGGAGNDWFNCTRIVDFIEGGAGVDTISYANVNAGVGVQLSADQYISGVENVIGTAFYDSIRGTTSANTLTGGGGDDYLDGYVGNDTLSGEDGNDTLDGGVGSDALYGGAGADILRGGGNSDQLVGGTGADRFVWEGDLHDVAVTIGRAVVLDFAVGVDKIDLSAVDADWSKDGRQSFEWIGMDQPLTGAGQLTFALGVIKGEMDGYVPSPAEFEIQLNGVTTMSASDFVL